MVSKGGEFVNILRRGRVSAVARVAGSGKYPDINGRVSFFQTARGVLVVAEVSGLPHSADVCRNGVFGFHIHSGLSCTGTPESPFMDAGPHLNPHGCDHPHHAGDLPPLFENGGYAYMAVLTDRFTVSEIVGHTVIIHANPDDFVTQPSGNSGEMMACGQINQ